MLVLRALLREEQTTVLVLLGEHQGFDLVVERDHLVGVDVVTDREFLARDDALGLVSDVEQHLVVVDLYDLAAHDVAVVEVDHRLIDGVFERHTTEVVLGDLGQALE